MICHPCAVEPTMLRRRPVEYNLIHDDSKLEPEIEVNLKKVEVVSWRVLSMVINPSNAEFFSRQHQSSCCCGTNVMEFQIMRIDPTARGRLSESDDQGKRQRGF